MTHYPNVLHQMWSLKFMVVYVVLVLCNTASSQRSDSAVNKSYAWSLHAGIEKTAGVARNEYELEYYYISIENSSSWISDYLINNYAFSLGLVKIIAGTALTLSIGTSLTYNMYKDVHAGIGISLFKVLDGSGIDQFSERGTYFVTDKWLQATYIHALFDFYLYKTVRKIQVSARASIAKNYFYYGLEDPNPSRPIFFGVSVAFQL